MNESATSRETVPALTDLDWPARTDRLRLRPATAADSDETWRYHRLEPVRRWMTYFSQTADEHRARFTEPARLARTLVVELGDTVIGDVKIDIEDAWAQNEVADRAKRTQAELGWCLHPDYTGRGYATEAVTEMIRLAFKDLGLRRVTALCFADNEPSWRLMERVGMRREMHTVADSLHRSKGWIDGLGYALLAGEWRDRSGISA